MVPIAVTVAWAERRWVARSVVVGLIGVGVFVYTLSSAMFPHFPEKFKNPVFELVLPLIGGGHAPYNAGWLLGLRGFASLFPYLLLVLGTWIWVACPSKQDRRSALVGSLLAAAILLIYSTFPGGGALADGAYERILTWMP
jgi:hypothetical protein